MAHERERTNRATEFVVWGFNTTWQRVPIKLTGGTLRECGPKLRQWKAEGWTCATYRKGTEPTGLREQAAAIHKGE